MPRNEKPPKEPSFVRGLVGIGVASFVGLLIWFGVTSFLLGFMKYLGIGLGAMIGWTGAWLGQHKSQKLGIAAGAATALTLIIGTLWVSRHEGLVLADEELKETYDAEVAYAKQAVKAKTDEEILKVMDEEPQMELDEDSDSGDEGLTKVTAKAQQTDAQRVAEWKKKKLPELRKFAEGKVSRLQFEKDRRPVLETRYGAASLFYRAFRKSMIVCFVVAVGAAFKISSSN